MIKRFILHAKKTAFVVEHDFIMATYLADNVVVFDGEPGVNTYVRAPLHLLVPRLSTFLMTLFLLLHRCNVSCAHQCTHQRWPPPLPQPLPSLPRIAVRIAVITIIMITTISSTFCRYHSLTPSPLHPRHPLHYYFLCHSPVSGLLARRNHSCRG